MLPDRLTGASTQDRTNIQGRARNWQLGKADNPLNHRARKRFGQNFGRVQRQERLGGILDNVDLQFSDDAWAHSPRNVGDTPALNLELFQCTLYLLCYLRQFFT